MAMSMHEVFCNENASQDDREKIADIKARGAILAAIIERLVPTCKDRDQAILLIRQGVMMAERAVVLEGNV